MRRMSTAVLLCCLGACGGDATRAEVDADISEATDIAEVADVDSGDQGAGDIADAADVADTEVSPPARPWYEGAVIYEIFVRSFQDSDGDGIGDLRGIIDRLDYLNDGVPGAGDDLEVDGLWLMPIFASDSYHGYDVTDYTAIEPDYGTSADFDALIAACDARGIKVVLDFVMNHSGANHPWFVDARSGATAARRNWYVWRSDNPGWKQPFGTGNVWHPYGGSYFYGIFWSGMPDLNYREPAVAAEMTAIGKDWLGRGVAGFRLDAARYLVESSDGKLFEQPETHAFWRSLRADLGDDAYLVGEVWTGRPAVTTYWGAGKELHQAFDFDLQAAITKSVADGATNWLRSELAAQKSAGTPWGYAATFLSNHDLDRLSRKLDDAEQRAAAFLLMTLPGTPYLYYGDELGVKSASPPAPGGDEAKRGPLAWTAAPESNHGFTNASKPWMGFASESNVRNIATALASPTSLLRYYQALIRLRHAHPALTGEGVIALPATGQGGVLSLLRFTDDEVILTVVNLSAGEVDVGTLDVKEGIGLVGAGPWRFEGLLGSTVDESVSDPTAVPVGPRLGPYEGRIWKLSAAGP